MFRAIILVRNTSFKVCANFARLFYVYNTTVPFLKNKMSDEMFPQQQLFRLCQATTVNKELLVKFVQDHMMIHGDMERIVS